MSARGAVQGTNSFKKQKYGRPCPPTGSHRYFFKLLVLDTELDVDPKKGKKGVEEAMEDHVLEEAELTGRVTVPAPGPVALDLYSSAPGTIENREAPPGQGGILPAPQTPSGPLGKDR